VRTLVGAVVVAVLLIGVGSYAFVRHMRVQQAEISRAEPISQASRKTT
jgi:hypothetical protein